MDYGTAYIMQAATTMVTKPTEGMKHPKGKLYCRWKSEDGWQVIEIQETRTSRDCDATQSQRKDIEKSWEFVQSLSYSFEISEDTNAKRCIYKPELRREIGANSDDEFSSQDDGTFSNLTDDHFKTSKPESPIAVGNDAGRGLTLHGNQSSRGGLNQDAGQIANTSEAKCNQSLDTNAHGNREAKSCQREIREEEQDTMQERGPKISGGKDMKEDVVLRFPDDKDTKAEKGAEQAQAMDTKLANGLNQSEDMDIKTKHGLNLPKGMNTKAKNGLKQSDGMDKKVASKPNQSENKNTEAENGPKEQEGVAPKTKHLAERGMNDQMGELLRAQGSTSASVHPVLDKGAQNHSQKDQLCPECLNGVRSIKSKDKLHEENQRKRDEKPQMENGTRAEQKLQMENGTREEQKLQMENGTRAEQKLQMENETRAEQKLQPGTNSKSKTTQVKHQALENQRYCPDQAKPEEATDQSRLQAQYQVLEKEVKAIKLEVQALRVSPETVRPAAKETQHASLPMGRTAVCDLQLQRPTPKKQGLVWIVPEVLHKDDRLTTPLRQLADRVHGNLEIRPLPSSSITIKHVGNVILPVVAASRVGSDLQAAVQKARLKVPAVVLIYNHLAPHMSRIRTPTKDRLSDRKLVDSCQDMIDLVFWNGSMYDCHTNTRAMAELKRIWDIK